jgi:hypothetical protein
MTFIKKMIAGLTEKLTPNRVVAVMTPVFTLAAAALTGYVAKHFPGLPRIPASEIAALEGVVALSAAAAALKWIHGWQQHEARKAVQTGGGQNAA